MYGTSKITTAENVMLISYRKAKPAKLAETLNVLAKADVVVDMISQTAGAGGSIDFSFTAASGYLDTALRTLGPLGGEPLISGGYTKLNLFGEDMVESVGVAARALTALQQNGVEVVILTTSDLDISLLIRSEDVDIAAGALKDTFAL